MSSVPSESDPLEETLESTRRNIRQLEMDTFRVRADLTRLEVALESVKKRDVGATAESASLLDTEPPSAADFGSIESLSTTIDPPDALSAPAALEENIEVASPAETVGTHDFVSFPESDDCKLDASSEDVLVGTKPCKGAEPIYKLATRPIVASLVLHGAVLLAIVSITVAAVVRSEPTFTTTILDLGEKPPEHSESFDLGQLAALDMDNVGGPNATAESLHADAPGPLVNEVIPVDFESAAVGPANEGQAGLIGPPPTDNGTMPVGAGGNSANGSGKPTGSGSSRNRGGGGGRSGGPAGSALFFGTQTKGNRFVFVVDNSSSMKGGRFEMAIAELVKTVEGLSPRQSFYVIFVSDQPYPMFYPQPEPELIPATTQNKSRLRDWLPKAILASGHNRELIKAMDLAAALRPEAVYLLWDGDLKYSDAVRLDVMSHLTAPNQWNFVVHTIGLGITSLDGEQNLTAIAQAHHGVYRRVEVPKTRSR